MNDRKEFRCSQCGRKLADWGGDPNRGWIESRCSKCRQDNRLDFTKRERSLNDQRAVEPQQ